MKQFTLEELTSIKKELWFLNNLSSRYSGVVGIGIGDNCLNIYLESEDYKATIVPEYRGCTLIPIVTGEIEAL